MNDPLPRTSERLILRRFRPEDAATFHAYRNDPVAQRFQGWGSWSWSQTEAFIADMGGRRTLLPGAWTQIALELRAHDGGLSGHIGDLAVRLDGAAQQAEIGATLAPEARSRGYAGEGVALLLSLLFADIGVHRVTALADVRNVASLRLLERLGFRQEAHFVESFDDAGVWRDEAAFALLAREWRQRRARGDHGPAGPGAP